MSNTNLLSDDLGDAFIRLIAKQTGLEIRERDRAGLRDKIFLRMKALNLDFPINYYHVLIANTIESDREWQNFVTNLTNLESYFFRDKEQFILLRDRILPELIQRQEDTKTIRICSAGCSTGEEPYSLAILLKEILPDIEEWNITIFGLDLNHKALHKAQSGIYRHWSFRHVDPALKERYFQPINNHYCLDSLIKKMVNFKYFNLVKDPLPQPENEIQYFDLIVCRNIFIYFDSSAIAKVLDKFYHTLQPLGYLITGHSELYGQNLSQFHTKVFPESIIYQRPDNNLFQAGTPEQNLAPGATSSPRYNGVSPPTEPNNFTVESLLLDINKTDIEIAQEKNNLNLQQTALTLLKQLPPDTKLTKLGNQTAAELISQLETALKLSNS
ncbi:CheR family methyltransferase [Limnofasciculus baicalensis]|uniref:protein-glutamate O-methyltransferase n=1 Tax=Limnofasciculus baicalensis BBK-W-15 TaxID=2699891 RepID=A0AAE3KKZ6_9CYAN|nr:CheR family methyltransferase [Limnofasciculus baicalensis]MCP2727111.1 chemotaxis protein CheR [Limnofasciculus baicalensis BBK-W-15]